MLSSRQSAVSRRMYYSFADCWKKEFARQIPFLSILSNHGTVSVKETFTQWIVNKEECDCGLQPQNEVASLMNEWSRLRLMKSRESADCERHIRTWWISPSTRRLPTAKKRNLPGKFLFFYFNFAVNTIFFPSGLSAWIEPPWASQMLRAMDSPMPKPPVWELRDLSVR